MDGKNAFKVLKEKISGTDDLFVIEYIGEIIPKKAIYKIINSNSNEHENALYFSNLHENFFAKFYYSKVFENFTEIHTEYFPMGNLHQKLVEDPEYIRQNLFGFADSLVRIVEFIHCSNISHGDFTLKNIFLYQNERGFVNFKVSGFTNAKGYPNSVRFLRKDLWDLGIVLAQMETGLLDEEKSRMSSIDLENFVKSQLMKKKTGPLNEVILKMIDSDFNVLAATVRNDLKVLADLNKCGNCKEILQENSVILACRHGYHKNCFLHLITQQIQYVLNLSDIVCLICSVPIESELENFKGSLTLPNRIRLNLLTFHQVAANCGIGHELKGVFMLNQELKPENVLCEICKKRYCSFCKKQKHMIKCDEFQCFLKDLQNTK